MSVRTLALTGFLVASLLSAGNAFALPRQTSSAAGAVATGVVTGQIVWCAPLPVPYGAPMRPGGAPMRPGADAAPQGAPGASPPEEVPEDVPQGAPGAAPEMAPGAAPDFAGPPRPFRRPPVPRSIPAGAVLVAVQGTALSARTDQNGRFRIEGVPVGQYLTVAAGPVGGAAVWQPNVFVARAGRTVDLGRLSLGQPCRSDPLPYGAPGGAPAVPGASPEQPEEGP